MNALVSYSTSFDALTELETALLLQATKSSAEVVKASKIYNGRLTRNFHAKSYAGIRGNLRITDFILGDYHLPENCIATVRFSNASSFINEDKKDIPAYGFSLRLENEEGFLANFPLVNFPVFPTSNCEKFLELVVAINQYIIKNADKKLPLSGIGDVLMSFSSLLIDKDILKITSVIKNTLKMDREFVLNYSYYSIGCYRFGDHICKIRVVPHSKIEFETEPETQEQGLQQTLGIQDIKFDLQIQLCKSLEDQPVNDLLIQWPEDQYKTIAILSFPKQIIIPSMDETLERMDYNPFLNPEQLLPVGKIQRTRNQIYQASYTARTSKS